MQFADRREAGQLLADRLQSFVDQQVVVLGLPRGGVSVAAEVARELAAPLDVIVVRKLGVPWQPELAMGAVGEDGVRVLNDVVIRQAGVSDSDLASVEAKERVSVAARARRLRGARSRVPLDGRVALIVDDGIATGATARAACAVARLHGAVRVVLAVPVAPTRWIEDLQDAADEYVAVQTPDPFNSVGQWFRDFSAVTDDEVAAILSA